ncbi:uncharacterized protein LOC122652325 [Telopea speciosissima]|uniref:uncharacterized protein LOC122652325 n=1 Tax=Telopea speciosissima TaxID=54955 RepID=UPI001CC699EB|nr:uncharacterized protein LOC122652325 [Telopea speciosissima]
MDETMIKCLQVQVWEGREVGNAFKESAYILAAKEMNSKHPQHHKEVTKENVINRFRTIKQTFRNLLLRLEQSGFGFDHTEKKLKVEDQIWYPFAAKSGREFMKLRNMSWPLFEELKEVVGEDHATGEFSHSNRDPSRQTKDKGTNFEDSGSYIHQMDHMEIGDTSGNEGLDTQVPKSTSQAGEGSRAGASHDVP